MEEFVSSHGSDNHTKCNRASKKTQKNTEICIN